MMESYGRSKRMSNIFVELFYGECDICGCDGRSEARAVVEETKLLAEEKGEDRWWKGRCHGNGDLRRQLLWRNSYLTFRV